MYGSPDNASDDASHFYFLLPSAKVGCHPAPFWLGAAAMTLIFFFLGFLASRLLLCCPFAMSISLGLRTTQIEMQNWSIRNQKVSSKIPSPHGAKATTPSDKRHLAPWQFGCRCLRWVKTRRTQCEQAAPTQIALQKSSAVGEPTF
jgi:hypothetical protein